MNEPKYDEEYVNLGYLKRTLSDAEIARAKLNSEVNKRSQNFGSQPTPPYYVNDTYMDGSNIYVCVNSRVIGSFTPTDWQLASKYVTDGDMDARLLSLSNAVDTMIEDLQNQLDGALEVWTYEGEPTLNNAPAVNWITNAEKDLHIGDVYNDMLTGDSYRFVYYDSEYLWLRITDSQAAAAYTLASEAKTTADSKMKVFVVTPVPPYRVGDLWAEGGSGGLYRCKNERLSGVFDSNDWEPATSYDETSTVIRNGLITTGTIVVNQGGSQTAGMTGNTSGDSSIRFWAGSSFEGRGSAPYRVTQGGKLYATGVDISGKITATSGSFTGSITAESGKIGGWNITKTYIDSVSGNGRLYIASNDDSASNYIQATGSDGVVRFSLSKNGVLTATGVNITGAITGTSGLFQGTVSGGSLNIANGSSYYLKMGASWTKHPEVSGLNVTGNGGINVRGLGFNASGSTWSFSGDMKVGNITSVTNITMSGQLMCTGNIKTNQIIPSGLLAIRTGGATGLPSGSGILIRSRNGHITINAGQNQNAYGVYAQGLGLANARVKTAAGDASSLNVKTNIRQFSDCKYNSALNLLNQIDLYEYEYKYNLYRDRSQYGFIIDYIEEIPGHEEFFDFESAPAKIDGDTLDFAISEEDTDILPVKNYNSDVLDKYLLTCVKALQLKMKELEEKLNDG